jgi:hypothetical protein
MGGIPQSVLTARIATSRPGPADGRRRSRRLDLVMMLTGGAVLLALLWLAVSVWWARSELAAARSEVTTLRSQAAAGDLAAARRTADSLARHASRAHGLTGNVVWDLAATLPGAEPLRTVRGMTAALDSVTGTALPDLLSVADALEPATLRRPDGSIDADRIAAAAPALTRATTLLDAAVTDVAALPAAGITAIDSARTDLLEKLRSVSSTLRTTDAAASVLPEMLGTEGPRTYLIALQNSAEARGTGGMAGAFGLLTVKDGRLSFGKFDSDRVLGGVAADVDLGAEYTARYASAATTTKYNNANLTPHFPYAAAIWASMWKKHSGKAVDGVIAVDPSVLSYVLAGTGPAKLPDGTVVSAENVVALTQATAYARYKDDDERRAFLVDVAKASIARISDGSGESVDLIKALARGARERRLMVWSAHPDTQRAVEQTPVAGVVPADDAPYAGLVVVNEAGNKLDYYLDRSVVWSRTGCGRRGEVVVTATLRNAAPTGLPDYVVARNDMHPAKARRGDHRVLASWYATAGATMESVRVDGKPASAAVGSERGHPVFVVDLELPRGATRTITWTLTEPVLDERPVTVLEQPLVRPMTVRVEDKACQ